ncbi:MAG: hypothetical protein RJA09_2739 [Pseudomonadota bacterium]
MTRGQAFWWWVGWSSRYRLFDIPLALLLGILWCSAQAQGTLFRVPTRAGVVVPVLWESTPDAQATVVLFPGGSGGFGRVEAGRATGQNFLVRSAHHFLAHGYNVAVLGRPSDTPDLGYPDRVSDAHMADVRAVLAFVQTQSVAPVWLVGTSRGSVSVAAAAIHIPTGIAGVVLASSVVSPQKPEAVPLQDLAAIRVPVLVVHHRQDACHLCAPTDVPAILRGLKHAPVKKEIWVTGGGTPTGNPCEALHWHGFVGMEREAVALIAGWLRRPVD